MDLPFSLHVVHNMTTYNCKKKEENLIESEGVFRISLRISLQFNLSPLAAGGWLSTYNNALSAGQMGSTTARIFTFISSSTGTPLLDRPSSSSLCLLRRLTTLSSPLILPPPLSNFHTRSHSAAFPAIALASLPWPEWSHFVDRISGPGVRNARHLDDGEFAAPSQLSDAFLNDVAALLAFVRRNPSLLWVLPREDIEVIIEYVSPSLFKDAAIVASRMRSFLAGDANYVSENEKPCTVDLMKFLLSYAHMVIISSEEVDNSGKVESSVRKLFSELAKSNRASAESVPSVQTHFLEGHGPRSRSFGNNIAMKKGDWICTRCSFMNFAKNQSCLQCEEARPKKVLIGGEWDCLQCDFLNFSRNVVCLRCDCKKPGGNPQQSPSGVSGFGSNRSSGISNTAKPLAERENQQQQWLTEITQLEESSDLSNSVADEDFSKFMPAGGSGAASQSGNLAVDANVDDVDIKARSGDNNINVHISKTLDELLGHRSPTSDTSNNDSTPGKSIKGESLSATSSAASLEYGNLSDAKSSRDVFASANAQLSVEKPASQMGGKEREQAEKSERWFQKVSEVNDVEELSSLISDEDFPEIMPMRTGENRFVVSKKKDRSLTSPMYKRRTAMEQAGSSNHVPFLPFPPGYFTQERPDSTSPSSKLKASGDAKTDIRNDSNYATLPGERTGEVSSDPGRRGVRNAYKTRDSNETSHKMDQTMSFDPQFSSSRSDGYSKTESRSGTEERENSSQTDMSWRGRSLEGSAVKEPDPLDMSEEAKTERWFRRVAQIKDISELSQIPDEDFPSIMPMRKGVNRFVVSKRKTPLERRLTSSQYRRNLPVVNSEPLDDRKETEPS